MSALLPCPFDGGAARLTDEEDFEVGGYFAGCSTCAASFWGDTQAEATAGWNTRVEPPCPTPLPSGSIER